MLYGMARYWAALVQEWYYPDLGLSSLNCGVAYIPGDPKWAALTATPGAIQLEL